MKDRWFYIINPEEVMEEKWYGKFNGANIHKSYLIGANDYKRMKD